MTIRIFEVGGSIRDQVLGLGASASKDRDFCVVCPEGWGGMREWAHAHMTDIWKEFPEYLTIRGKLANQDVDLVLCRKDGEYTDGRHPDEVEPGTLEDDLSRRDFTVNAMAAEVSTTDLSRTGEIVDLFNGVQDARFKWLRCVGKPEDRFREDAIRMLRAVRFCITKGLNPIANICNILKSREVWPELLATNIARERTREELEKCFAHDTVLALHVMNSLCSTEMLGAFFGDDIWLGPTRRSRT